MAWRYTGGLPWETCIGKASPERARERDLIKVLNELELLNLLLRSDCETPIKRTFPA